MSASCCHRAGQRLTHAMRWFTAVRGELSGKYISASSFLVYERIVNIIILSPPKSPLKGDFCLGDVVKLLNY